MHCLEPACVAGCPFGALKKTDKGVVSWTASACIGCRFCEVACPFDVPKFEWDHFNPKIVKCEFCREERLSKGADPACTTACPTSAVVFGTRKKLLADAHARLKQHPKAYAEARVYGEHEAGGTQVLYLSHVPFTKLGLPALSPDDRPGHALRFQTLLYKWLLFPLALYAALVAIIRKRWRVHDEEVRALEAKEGLKEQL
jgi:ferredoxin